MKMKIKTSDGWSKASFGYFYKLINGEKYAFEINAQKTNLQLRKYCNTQKPNIHCRIFEIID